MIEKAIPSSAASASDVEMAKVVEAQGVDSGIVECIDSRDSSWNSSSSEISSDDETRDNILLDLGKKKRRRVVIFAIFVFESSITKINITKTFY